MHDHWMMSLLVAALTLHLLSFFLDFYAMVVLGMIGTIHATWNKLRRHFTKDKPRSEEQKKRRPVKFKPKSQLKKKLKAKSKLRPTGPGKPVKTKGKKSPKSPRRSRRELSTAA